MLSKCSAPREYQYLSQSLRAHAASYADLTALDAKAAPDLSGAISQFELILAGARIMVARQDEAGTSEQFKAGYVNPETGTVRREAMIQG